MSDSVSIFKALGDETRFRIVSLLYKSDSYVELLAEKLELTPGTVCFHLKKLEAVGIVNCSRSQFYMIYSLNREMISRSMESFFTYEEETDKEDGYRKKVLSSFFERGRLKSIPVQEKKRDIVLSQIMQDFTENTYTEKEVNRIIVKYYDDFCTLRRYLVGYGFMSRTDGIYTVLIR